MALVLVIDPLVEEVYEFQTSGDVDSFIDTQLGEFCLELSLDNGDCIYHSDIGGGHVHNSKTFFLEDLDLRFIGCAVIATDSVNRYADITHSSQSLVQRIKYGLFIPE